MSENPNPGNGTEEVKPETEIKPEETQQPPQPKPEETVEFWKQKFSESSSEANLLREAEEQRKKAAQELTKQPTDSEFRTAFPDWDILDDSQKADKRRIYNAERTALAARQDIAEIKEERARNTSIELVVSSTPALQGKEQAFREYASRPQYKGIPIEVLVDAFLGKQGAAPEPPKPTPKPGLEIGNGGPRIIEKTKKFTAEELKTIRETDYRRYMEIVKSGQGDLE